MGAHEPVARIRGLDFLVVDRAKLGKGVADHTQINDNLLNQARAGQHLPHVVRVVVDTFIFFAFARKLLPETGPVIRRTGLIVSMGLIVLIVGIFIVGLLPKGLFLMGSLLMFILVAWFLLLEPGERGLIKRLFHPRPV